MVCIMGASALTLLSIRIHKNRMKKLLRNMRKVCLQYKGTCKFLHIPRHHERQPCLERDFINSKVLHKCTLDLRHFSTFSLLTESFFPNQTRK